METWTETWDRDRYLVLRKSVLYIERKQLAFQEKYEVRSLMQTKPRLPNILSFIGRLGNMGLMHTGCQGPLASYPRARDPQASQSPAHGKTRHGNSSMGRLVLPIVSRGVDWIGG